MIINSLEIKGKKATCCLEDSRGSKTVTITTKKDILKFIADSFMPTTEVTGVEITVGLYSISLEHSHWDYTGSFTYTSERVKGQRRLCKEECRKILNYLLILVPEMRSDTLIEVPILKKENPIESTMKLDNAQSQQSIGIGSIIFIILCTCIGLICLWEYIVYMCAQR